MKSDITKLHALIQSNTETREQLEQTTDPTEFVAIVKSFAREHGLSVSESDIAPFLPAADGELSDEQLEHVAGGKYQSGCP